MLDFDIIVISLSFLSFICSTYVLWAQLKALKDIDARLTCHDDDLQDLTDTGENLLTMYRRTDDRLVDVEFKVRPLKRLADVENAKLGLSHAKDVAKYWDGQVKVYQDNLKNLQKETK